MASPSSSLSSLVPTRLTGASGSSDPLSSSMDSTRMTSIGSCDDSAVKVQRRHVGHTRQKTHGWVCRIRDVFAELLPGWGWICNCHEEASNPPWRPKECRFQGGEGGRSLTECVCTHTHTVQTVTTNKTEAKPTWTGRSVLDRTMSAPALRGKIAVVTRIAAALWSSSRRNVAIDPDLILQLHARADPALADFLYPPVFCSCEILSASLCTTATLRTTACVDCPEPCPLQRDRQDGHSAAPRSDDTRC